MSTVKDEKFFADLDSMREPRIKTDRLRLHVASRAEMQRLIMDTASDILKTAYREMLNGATEHPDLWPWYAVWMIELKNGTHVGECCFKGVSGNGVTEIGYGIDEKYRMRGYATEAVRAITDWALV